MLMLRLSPAVADEPLLESSDCHIWLHLELKKEFVCHRVRDENCQRRHVLSVAKHRERRTSATTGVSWRGGERQILRRYSAQALHSTVLCSSLRKLRVWTLLFLREGLDSVLEWIRNVVHMYICTIKRFLPRTGETHVKRTCGVVRPRDVVVHAYRFRSEVRPVCVPAHTGVPCVSRLPPVSFYLHFLPMFLIRMNCPGPRGALLPSRDRLRRARAPPLPG